MDPEEREARRRRLYAPGATDEDVRRYRGALDDRAVEAAVRRRVPRGRAAALVLVVVLAIVAVIALPRRPADPPAPLAAQGEAVTVRVAGPLRREFVRNLQQGRPSGLASAFYEHPGLRPPQLTTLTRAATEEHVGRGTRTIPLEPSTEADRGGRLTVVVTLATGARASWAALRSAVRTDHATYDQVVAIGADRLTAGLPVSRTVRYTGAAPDRLRIRVPGRETWDALVVFSD